MFTSLLPCMEQAQIQELEKIREDHIINEDVKVYKVIIIFLSNSKYHHSDCVDRYVTTLYNCCKYFNTINTCDEHANQVIQEQYDFLKKILFIPIGVLCLPDQMKSFVKRLKEELRCRLQVPSDKQEQSVLLQPFFNLWFANCVFCYITNKIMTIDKSTTLITIFEYMNMISCGQEYTKLNHLRTCKELENIRNNTLEEIQNKISDSALDLQKFVKDWKRGKLYECFDQVFNLILRVLKHTKKC